MYIRSVKVSETPSSQHLLKHRGVSMVTDYVLTRPYSVAPQMAVHTARMICARKVHG